MFQTHLSFLYFTSIFCISTIHLLCSATDDIFHKILVSLNLVGGFSPSEKYESQLGLLLPIYGKS